MEEAQQSEFNMAVSYLNRLNYLCYTCDMASMELNAYEWFQSLMSLYRELCVWITPQEKAAYDKKASDLFTEINKTVHYQNQQGYNGSLPPKLYWNLHNFNTFLMETMQKSNLLTKMQNDPRLALR